MVESRKKLGFGFMRLPLNPDGSFNEAETFRMVDMFMQRGFTYFDTAYSYFSGGSEKLLRKALVERYPRDSYTIASKLPSWEHKETAEDVRNMFSTSIERLGVDYLDYYLVHAVSAKSREYYDRYGVWDYFLELKEKGLVKHIGFSFHDSAEVLDQILTEHPQFEFVQLQINYKDWEDPVVQSRKCHDVAVRHGKDIIIMEPVKGGNLATLPDNLRRIFTDYDPEKSISSYAVRFAASLENVRVVLSGMSTLKQMEDNTSYMENFEPLTEEERKRVFRVMDGLNAIESIPCTGCGYCRKGCPSHIEIPDLFAAMNSKIIFDNDMKAHSAYLDATEKSTPDDCIECRQCESVCPQHIDIVDRLKFVRENLG